MFIANVEVECDGGFELRTRREYCSRVESDSSGYDDEKDSERKESIKDDQDREAETYRP